jgi:hypothetical protein
MGYNGNRTVLTPIFGPQRQFTLHRDLDTAVIYSMLNMIGYCNNPIEANRCPPQLPTSGVSVAEWLATAAGITHNQFHHLAR